MNDSIGRKRAGFAWSTLVVAIGMASSASAQVQNQVFTTIAPCRLIDTRTAALGKMSANEARPFNIFGNLAAQGGPAGGCALPAFTADGVSRVQALAINYVAVLAEAQGNLKAWPTDLAEPSASIINFAALAPPTNLANGTITAVRQDVAGSDFTIRASQKVHVVADVVGYFQRQAMRTEITGDESLNPGKTPNMIGGASINSVTSPAIGATIAGGGQQLGAAAKNAVTDDFGTVGGGRFNQAGDGLGSTSDRILATVCGGNQNKASGGSSTVAGGGNNTASGAASAIGGGVGNQAAGIDATVPGGSNNFASGDFSFAAGHGAKVGAAHDGSFLFADNSPAGPNFDFDSSAANQFLVRAVGGTTFFSSTALTTGVSLPAGSGAWGAVSDRAVKENLRPLDPKQIAAKVAALPIGEWNYRTQDDSVRHVGPMAQDFRAAFGLGEDDKHISTIDADGVALAAIKGLHAMVKEKDAEIAALRRQLQAQARETERRLKALEEHSRISLARD